MCGFDPRQLWLCANGHSPKWMMKTKTVPNVFESPVFIREVPIFIPPMPRRSSLKFPSSSLKYRNFPCLLPSLPPCLPEDHFAGPAATPAAAQPLVQATHAAQAAQGAQAAQARPPAIAHAASISSVATTAEMGEGRPCRANFDIVISQSINLSTYLPT